MAAMSEARRARLAASAAIYRGTAKLPDAVEAAAEESRRAEKARKKGEFVLARERFEDLSSKLTDEETNLLSVWASRGPTLKPHERTSDGAPLADNGEPPSPHATTTVNGADVVGTVVSDNTVHVAGLARRSIDYSEFAEHRRDLIAQVWEARAFYYALATDRELNRLYWPDRGNCRATVEWIEPNEKGQVDPEHGVIKSVSMGDLRDKITALRQIPRHERDTAQVDALRILERELTEAEHWHERELVKARKLAQSKGLGADDALIHPDYNGKLCPYCAGTSVIRPTFDAPASIMREWFVAVKQRADARFIRREAIRRGRMNFDLDLGHTPWAEYRKSILEPFSRRTGSRR